MVHWLIKRNKLCIGLKYKPSIRQANVTSIEQEVLSGAWVSTLLFVMKGNAFYPAFIYKLVLVNWLKRNKEHVISIFR